MKKFQVILFALTVISLFVASPTEAQIIYRQQYAPQQVVPQQRIYQQQIIQQPAMNQQVQGQLQTFQGRPGVRFDRNNPDTFYGTTRVVEGEATAERPWDPSQGYNNDDQVLAVEFEAHPGMVMFHYPADAKAPLNYQINEYKAVLKPGENLKVPSGDDFKFAFVPKAGAEAVPHDISKDGDFIFKATDAGWKLVEYVPPQLQKKAEPTADAKAEAKADAQPVETKSEEAKPASDAAGAEAKPETETKKPGPAEEGN